VDYETKVENPRVFLSELGRDRFGMGYLPSPRVDTMQRVEWERYAPDPVKFEKNSILLCEDD
jgi:hypothetical protein